ncbi:MAG: MBL fold metallo-hydrolase [candidate division WOR-3 bacterium]|nr:MBL fold metallo-hydrolase [candidate division WOR-3 bacterium]
MKNSNDLIIKTFIVGYIETNMYLIHDTRTGIIIDPGFSENEADSVVKKLRREVSEIPIVILTHCHFDHISGCPVMKKEFNSKIYCHRLDEEKLVDPHKSGAIFFGVSGTPVKPDGYLEEGQVIKLNGSELKIIHTPGHTSGGISILLDGKYLFSGDTIFKDGIGRTDLYDGDYDIEISSIMSKILTLPEDTIIYPGHGPSTTVREERKNF